MIDLNLNKAQLSYVLSPKAVRERSFEVFERVKRGQGNFVLDLEKVDHATTVVVKTIEENYPDLKIPFHSRWSHFQAGGVDRLGKLRLAWKGMSEAEALKSKLDLAIVSVLLDAGSGPGWSYQDVVSGKTVARSEGLAVASLQMFLKGAFSGDSQGRAFQVNAARLVALKEADLTDGFQVSASNPLLGVSGRLQLLWNLGHLLQQKLNSPMARPSDLFEKLSIFSDRTDVEASQVLQVVLWDMGAIWPSRLKSQGVCLGDTWVYSELGNGFDAVVPFHKLSQWLTYSLLEPLIDYGHRLVGLSDLTGLPEYRNGGLMIDSGLIRLKDPKSLELKWSVDSQLIIEWRALTVTLLDILAQQVRKKLKRTEGEFPLVRVLEGGTWWAGRKLAAQMRKGGTPPLNIVSDGTVF